MGKTSKWLRSLLIGKKKKEKDSAQVELLRAENLSAPIPVPATKEKRRWSFRRSVGAAKELSSPELTVTASCLGLFEPEIDQNRHALAVAVATAAAADAAVAAAQAAAAVVRLTVAANERTARAIEEEAAIKIQSIFRSYLARKALCALKGLVKLQALVRGHLVRKQATATFRCMQALVNAQARAVAQRIRMVEESQGTPQKQLNYRRSPQQSRFRHSFEMDGNMEEFVKIVEMDITGTRSNSKSRSSYSLTPSERSDLRFCSYNSATHTPSKADLHPQFSPAPSALTELSPRGCSGHFDEFSFATAQSSPHMSAMSMPVHNYFDYPLYPNYMANTESSKAKARSQSAPKQRPDAYERQTSRRRPSVEGRTIPRVVKMQRSSSHVSLTTNSYQYPWSIKLDKSSLSLKGSECGSTSTIPTNTNYCRSLVGNEVVGNNY